MSKNGNGNNRRHYSTKSLKIGMPDTKQSKYWRNKIKAATMFKNKKFVTPKLMEQRMKVKIPKNFKAKNKFKKNSTPSLAPTALKSSNVRYSKIKSDWKRPTYHTIGKADPGGGSK